MLVSWNWLKQYVPLDMPQAELEDRLAMSGLNHESTESFADDLVIDLEVTSNRPDCLGHLGIAREIAVLWGQPLEIPDPQPATNGQAVGDAVGVRIDCPDLCSRYTARVIRGAKVKASPDWLAARLLALGQKPVNNVVDITNYVLFESGQPLHAFDFARLHGPEIIVRRPTKGEKLVAINHETYELQPEMCVIADADRPVALGGVMGGADTEVDFDTKDLLIEAADFEPLSIRTTARALTLHSPSSYRFERGVDPRGIDWASRRCCEMILDLAGGELLDGVLDVGKSNDARSPVVLRLAQLPRILGIEVEIEEVRRILAALGCEEGEKESHQVTVIPPSWRRDLTREVDLIEEVARIHGYDKIPEDVAVPMAPSHRRDDDRLLERVRHVLTAGGFDEALTTSVVPEEWTEAFSPWTDQPALECNVPMLKGSRSARLSLIPSLLEARRINQSLANPEIELFETARIYLPRTGGLPQERWVLGICSSQGFDVVKGVLEAVADALNSRLDVDAIDFSHPLLQAGKSCELQLRGERWGFLGQLSDDGAEQFGIRSATTIAEVDLQPLRELADLVPQYKPLSPFPLTARDLNLIVSESVRWSDLRNTVRQSAGDCLEDLHYLETYRDPQRDGEGKKRILLSLSLRSAERTMTSGEADQIRDQVEAACQKAHQAVLLR